MSDAAEVIRVMKKLRSCNSFFSSPISYCACTRHIRSRTITLWIYNLPKQIV